MNQNDQMRDALQEFVAAMDECSNYPDTTRDRERLESAKRKAERALNHTPDTGEMANHVGDSNKMVELFDQVVSPAILNCIGKIAGEITVRRIWDEVRRAMLKNNGVQHD